MLAVLFIDPEAVEVVLHTVAASTCDGQSSP